jgi:hypothetical protein
VQTFIDHGADIHVEDEYHRSLFYHLFKSTSTHIAGVRKIIRILIDAGIDVQGDRCINSAFIDALERGDPRYSPDISDNTVSLFLQDICEQLLAQQELRRY